MIYTLGHKENYLKILKETPGAKKLGPRPEGNTVTENGEPYAGGIAFETVTDALRWREENNKLSWSPFELDGDWSDVYWDEENKHFRINRDLVILGEAE